MSWFKSKPKPDKWFTFRVQRYTTGVQGDEYGTRSFPAVEVEIVDRPDEKAQLGQFEIIDLNDLGVRPAIGDLYRGTYHDGWAELSPDTKFERVVE